MQQCLCPPARSITELLPSYSPWWKALRSFIYLFIWIVAITRFGSECRWEQLQFGVFFSVGDVSSEYQSTPLRCKWSRFACPGVTHKWQVHRRLWVHVTKRARPEQQEGTHDTSEKTCAIVLMALYAKVCLWPTAGNLGLKDRKNLSNLDKCSKNIC